jgi:hypothetical protein
MARPANARKREIPWALVVACALVGTRDGSNRHFCEARPYARAIYCSPCRRIWFKRITWKSAIAALVLLRAMQHFESSTGFCSVDAGLIVERSPVDADES